MQQDKEMITKHVWCLLDYQCLQDHYQLTAVNLCKREELGSKAIQQNEFYGMSDTNSQICTKLKKTKKKKKKTNTEFYKGATKILW